MVMQDTIMSVTGWAVALSLKGVCALARESVAMVILSGKKDLVGVIKDPGTEPPARVIWVGSM